jgi:hypothetical protein
VHVQRSLATSRASPCLYASSRKYERFFHPMMGFTLAIVDREQM